MPNQFARGFTTIEPLERRLLWAADLVPSTINGLVIQMTVTSATGDYAPVSAIQFNASADDATYTMQGSLNGPGTFEFGHGFGANVANLNALDSAGSINANAPSISAKMTFSSLTAGTFEVMAPPHLTGSMTGTFAITGTTKPLTALSNGVLAISGTVGNDTVSIASSGGNISVVENNFTTQYPASSVTGIGIDLREGNDALLAGAGIVGAYCYAGAGNDNLVGGDGNDTLSGGAGADLIDGGLGDDRLNGNGSRDHLIGSAGRDRLFGGNSNDLLEGGAGGDRLFGGAGNDILIGGAGSDRLFGEAGNDSLAGNSGFDLLDGGDDTDAAANDGVDSLLNAP